MQGGIPNTQVEKQNRGNPTHPEEAPSSKEKWGHRRSKNTNPSPARQQNPCRAHPHPSHPNKLSFTEGGKVKYSFKTDLFYLKHPSPEFAQALGLTLELWRSPEFCPKAPAEETHDDDANPGQSITKTEVTKVERKFFGRKAQGGNGVHSQFLKSWGCSRSVLTKTPLDH